MAQIPRNVQKIYYNKKENSFQIIKSMPNTVEQAKFVSVINSQNKVHAKKLKICSPRVFVARYIPILQ